MQFPANARFAMPIALALMVWVIFNVVGIMKQGPIHYLKNSVVPPGVPKAILPLVVIIEVVSVFLVRPFSLAVRLFANMLAGHLILVTFSVLCAALFAKSISLVILPVRLRLARRPHRVRDPRELPAGVHLHNPGCRVHRQLHAPRALSS